MTASPLPAQRQGNLVTVGWFAIAVLPGLLHPALGVIGAGLAARRSPRVRWVFVAVAAVWLAVWMLVLPRMWGATSVEFGGPAPRH